MGTLLKPGDFDCLDKLLPDEPYFLVLARSPEAPATVRKFAELRRARIEVGDAPVSDYCVTTEAEICAKAMAAWRTANKGDSHVVPRWKHGPSGLGRKPISWADMQTAIERVRRDTLAEVKASLPMETRRGGDDRVVAIIDEIMRLPPPRAIDVLEFIEPRKAPPFPFPPRPAPDAVEEV